MQLLSQSKFGKWALWVFMALVISLVALLIINWLFDPIAGAGFFGNWVFAIPILVSWVFSGLTLTFSLLAMLRQHDYSVTVILFGIVSLYAFVFGTYQILTLG